MPHVLLRRLTDSNLRFLSRQTDDWSEAAHCSVQNLGTDWDERVLPSIGNEIVKAVVARYNAEQLLTQRDKVSKAVSRAAVVRNTLSRTSLASAHGVARQECLAHCVTSLLFVLSLCLRKPQALTPCRYALAGAGEPDAARDRVQHPLGRCRDHAPVLRHRGPDFFLPVASPWPLI